MESRIKIIATTEEMEKFFDENDVCSVRYYNTIGNDLFEVIIRHAERRHYLKGIYTIPQIINKLQTGKKPQAKFKLLTVKKEEHSLFFYSKEKARDYGMLGYLRGYFDSDSELWTRWFDIMAYLKTDKFEAEFDIVTDYLKCKVSNSLESVKAYCDAHSEQKIEGSLNGNAYGFKVKTSDYSYYVRFFPCKGDYNVYIFAYENHHLLPALSADANKKTQLLSGNAALSKTIKEVYQELNKLGIDPDGSHLYGMAKELIDLDVYTHFAAEDNRGFFEDADDRKLLKWLIIGQFADIEWDYSQPPYEKYDYHLLDENTPEYIEFEEKLYPSAIINMIKSLEETNDKYAAVQKYLSGLEHDTLSKLLYHKVEDEYERWISEIKALSPDEIVENAYDIMLFGNIVYILDERPEIIEVDEVRALLSLDDTLLEIQGEWFDRDSSFMSDLEDAICDLARKVKKKVKRIWHNSRKGCLK